jgi:hypothetical protein
VPVVTPAPSPQPAVAPPPPAIKPPPFSSADCNPQTAGFYDDFHTQDPGWNLSSGDPVHYANGQLVVAPKLNAGFAPKYLALRYQNATVCAHVQSPPEVKVAGQGSGGGITFWAANSSNFYVAEITPDGEYWVSRLVAGNWVTVVPSTKSPQVKSGANVVNEVRLDLVDNFAALFVNNVKVQEFRGQPPESGAAVGLRADSETTASNEWRFLDIAVMDNGKSKSISLPPAPSGPTFAGCRPVNSVDFQDTFAKPDSAWGADGTIANYVDGQFSIKPVIDKYSMRLYRPLLYRNAAICMTVKFPAEIMDSDDPSGGPSFWATDYRNFYVAKIYPNGTFNIARKINDEWVTVIQQTPSDAIKKGAGQVNDVQLVVGNNSGVLYINGTKAQEFRGQPPQEGGAIGLFASSEAHQQNEWRFLNVAVVETQ